MICIDNWHWIIAFQKNNEKFWTQEMLWKKFEFIYVPRSSIITWESKVFIRDNCCEGKWPRKSNPENCKKKGEIFFSVILWWKLSLGGVSNEWWMTQNKVKVRTHERQLGRKKASIYIHYRYCLVVLFCIVPRRRLVLKKTGESSLSISLSLFLFELERVLCLANIFMLQENNIFKEKLFPIL